MKRKRKLNRRVLPSSTRSQHIASRGSQDHLASSIGRTLIRRHHILQKKLSAALAEDEADSAAIIREEIAALGGLKRYQDASLAGQSKERGGDTSKMLVKWLAPESTKHSPNGRMSGMPQLAMLEVGALSPNNACTKSALFNGGIDRIDLHSQDPKIKTQDFMERPLPKDEGEAFDVVSLSLVINYVGQPQDRGRMLQRVGAFLEPHVHKHQRQTVKKQVHEMCGIELLPALFLVLPAPCVMNSRYLDEMRLEAMMQLLGYRLTRRKVSAKLGYYLFTFMGAPDDAKVTFRKKEVRKGSDRNNFAIELT